MKLNVTIINCLIALFFLDGLYKQDKSVHFSYSQLIKNDIDRIQLKIENNSDSTIYYTIGVEALTDTGWVFLLGNLDALGKNEWSMLKVLPAKTIAKKMASKKQVFETYYFVKPKKIRFYLEYNTRRSFDGNMKTMEVFPWPN